MVCCVCVCQMAEKSLKELIEVKLKLKSVQEELNQAPCSLTPRTRARPRDPTLCRSGVSTPDPPAGPSGAKAWRS